MRRGRKVALAAAFAMVAGALAGVLVPLFLTAREPAAGNAPAAVPSLPPAATFDRTFEPCAHCHQIGEGARNTAGPLLQGLIGRRAGQEPGYPFSQAMRDSGLVWNEATLARFIEDPQRVIPGTRMIFAGIGDSAKRAAIVEYIARASGKSHLGSP